MTALDFPATPTDGQIFTAGNGVTYRWSAAKTLWLSIANSPTGLATPTFDMTNVTFPAVGVIPFDDTIPQITEGARVFQRVFTANTASNPIDVDAEVVVGTGAAGVNFGLALFVDNAPDAVAAKVMILNVAQGLSPMRIRWRGVLAAGAHTFELRYGGNTAAYLNRNDSGRIYGGALQATMSITEIGSGQGPRGPDGAPGAAGGPACSSGTVPPASPVINQLWFNTDASAGGGQMYIWYDDGNTQQWVPAGPPSTLQNNPLIPVITLLFDNTPTIIKQNNNGTYRVTSITKASAGNYTLNGTFPANALVQIQCYVTAGGNAIVAYPFPLPTTTAIGFQSLSTAMASADAVRYVVTVYQ